MPLSPTGTLLWWAALESVTVRLARLHVSHRHKTSSDGWRHVHQQQTLTHGSPCSPSEIFTALLIPTADKPSAAYHRQLSAGREQERGGVNKIMKCLLIKGFDFVIDEIRGKILGFTLIQQTPFSRLGSVRLGMFLKEVSSSHQGCIYLVTYTVKL